MPLPDGSYIIPAVPGAPAPYALHHPDRIQQFLFASKYMFDHENSSTDDIDSSQWRHELDHDIESVFWLMLYWAVGVQPENGSNEAINPLIWAGLMGSVDSRSILLKCGDLEIATHSAYRPLGSLLNKLAAIIVIDRHWFESDDPRNHPGYANEAFQRLILQFIFEHREKKFMRTPVRPQLRQPPKPSQNLSLSQTSTQT